MNRSVTVWHMTKQVAVHAKLAPLPQPSTLMPAVNELTQVVSRDVVGKMWQQGIGSYTPWSLIQGTALVIEVAGLFTLGEIIARRQIFGYKY